MKKFVWVPFFLTLVIAQDNNLFFSEYAEGSSNNKYLEIYNGTGSNVDLSNYASSPGLYISIKSSISPVPSSQHNSVAAKNSLIISSGTSTTSVAGVKSV